MIRVKPAKPEMVIRDPKSMAKLPPEGKRVPETSYWIRRLMCGDVVLVDEDPAPAKPSQAPQKPKPAKKKAQE